MSQLMTLEELADYLRVGKKTIFRLLERKSIPASRVGHQWRFDKSEIDDWLKKGAQKQLANILVIDDDEMICSLFEETLVEHKVTAVSDSAAGLELLENEEYDLVFLDLIMPGIKGTEILKRVKESRPELPVTIITGYQDSELMMEALKYGPLGVISKPFSGSDIIAAVNHYLRFGASD